MVLQAATYLDMALTGRPASSTPTAVGGIVARRLDLPTDGERPEAWGALLGAASGLGVGAAAGLLRSAGVRLPLLAEAAVVGAGAMALSDGTAVRLGVTDPADWSGRDWLRDAVPHLAYGAAVAASLRRLSAPSPVPVAPPVRPVARSTGRPRRVLARSLAVGLAAGARSTLGLPRALAVGPRTSVVSGALVASELVADKLPAVPSRLEPGPALGRIGSGALGAVVLARREDGGGLPLLPLLVGGLGAAAGTVLGAAWREVATERGWTWQGAAVEDVVALSLAAWAWKERP